MATIRIYLVLAILSLFLSSNTIGQSSPLSVTGTVTAVNVQPGLRAIPIDKDKPRAGVKFERYPQTEPWFDVVVQLQVCNRDEVTLIVPTIFTLRFGTTKISFLELPSSESKVVATATPRSRYDLSRFDPIPSFLKELEKSEPSKDRFAVIEPGTCYNASDMISVTSGFKPGVLPSEDKSKRPIEIAIPEYSQFKIHYWLMMKDSMPVSDANRRWKKFGKLVTTSDGDFVLETEFIINKLRD